MSVCSLLDSSRGQSRNVLPHSHLPFTLQYFWKATMDLAEKLHFPVPLWLGRLRRFQQELWRLPSAAAAVVHRGRMPRAGRRKLEVGRVTGDVVELHCSHGS